MSLLISEKKKKKQRTKKRRRRKPRSFCDSYIKTTKRSYIGGYEIVSNYFQEKKRAKKQIEKKGKLDLFAMLQ